MHFGKNIRHLRERMNLTQIQLASRLDVNHTTIGGWETGKSYPHFNTLLTLRELFHIDLESLVFRDIEKEGYIDMVEEQSTPYRRKAEEYESEIMELKRLIAELQSQVERASLSAEKVDAMSDRMALVEKELRLLGGEVRQRKE